MLSPEVKRILKEKGGIKLDVGCGDDIQAGFVGMDVREVPGVDIVHDMEDIPWPLPDESVITAVCSHVVEHVNPAHMGFIKFMDELWRVMKYDGVVAIVTPYAGSIPYWQDPTHLNGCNEYTFTYFDPLSNQGNYYRNYRPKPWALQKNYFSPEANLEVVLKKRRDDRSYHEEGEYGYDAELKKSR